MRSVTIAVVCAKEKGAILQDRAAHARAEFILMLRRADLVEESASIENRVAEVFERGAVELIRSRLQNVVLGTLTVEFDGLAAGLDLELVHGFDGNSEAHVPAFALLHGVRHGDAFDVHFF